MKAIVVVPGAAGPELELRDVPEPVPGPHDLLVRVRAAGLNRADLARVQQHYKSTGPDIAGLEAAGEVIATGEEVGGFSAGDRVMAMCVGAYAEKALIDHRIALKVPQAMGWGEAAAVPTWFLTAHDAVIVSGRLAGHETLLIQAAASGVGLAALQVAKAMGVAAVIGTSRDKAKLARLISEFGLDHAIDTASEDFATRALELTGQRGVDVIMDNIGASALAGNMAALALRGRLIGVGRMGGRIAEIDLDLLALKRLELIGVTFRTRTIEEKAELGRRAMADLGGLIDGGRLRPVVDRSFPLDAAAQAQDYMRSNTHLGKIVLTL
jgi:NADPH2:quinone reductase